MGNYCAHRRSCALCCKRRTATCHAGRPGDAEDAPVNRVQEQVLTAGGCSSGCSKLLRAATGHVGCFAAPWPRRKRRSRTKETSHRNEQLLPGSSSPVSLRARYHKLSQYPSMAGYIGSLAAEHVSALRKLKHLATTSLGSIKPFLLHSGESEEQLLLRFLRARKFDVVKAFDMLKADFEWRREEEVSALASRTENEVLGSNREAVHATMPWKHIGSDRQGRPIIAKHMGHKCDLSKLMRQMTIEELMQYHIWQQENCCKLMAEQSRRLGVSVEQYIFAIDASQWYYGLATCKTLQFLRSVAAVDSDHYPERLAFCVIVNASPALALLWRIAKSWLTPRQQAKFRFCTTSAEAREVMSAHIDDITLLPQDLGGFAPPLGFVD
eukprot:TRINITY_DN2638_c0_g1_i1.p1 TRINITY_DN2638_c0_g1~~TRINITY_DN2638_c0_g1_i1.p1  ORF type:complete len:394 (-),score=46.02 TRINITY_DN2638_c0_g1_i1:144-1289(-)